MRNITLTKLIYQIISSISFEMNEIINYSDEVNVGCPEGLLGNFERSITLYINKQIKNNAQVFQISVF